MVVGYVVVGMVFGGLIASYFIFRTAIKGWLKAFLDR